jgi:hypothetical protein
MICSRDNLRNTYVVGKVKMNSKNLGVSHYKEEKSLQRNGNRKRMSTKKEVSKREGLNIN